MFKLDMDSIRRDALDQRLMANPANLANPAPTERCNVSQLAVLAKLAISHTPDSLQIDMHVVHLLKAAMKRCDQFGDGSEAREEMRRQCLELPPPLQVDLLDHFRSVNNISSKDAPK